MIALTERRLDKPQRVRQFSVSQPDESPGAAEESAACENDASERRGDDGYPADLPAFLKHRSLRRRLDDAYAACYHSNVTDWFRSLFRRS